MTKRLTIVGAGSWGLTLAWLLGSSGQAVGLYTRDQNKADLLNRVRKTETPVAVELPANVAVTSDLSESLKDSAIVLFCCTSQSMREVAQKVRASAVSADLIAVSAAKGLELSSLKRMSEVLEEILPNHPVCALSGPNLAPEILKRLPAATVVASRSPEHAKMVQKAISVDRFRVYANDDIVGVEWGGTLKNVIAIAAGASDGLNLGANAKAALMTRGLAEMARLAVSLGAKQSTLSGLSGMGDLVATCQGQVSRNYRFGFQLAQGVNVGDALESAGAVVEGVNTANAVCELSKKLGIELPIAQQVDAALKGAITPQQAIMALMSRPLAIE